MLHIYRTNAQPATNWTDTHSGEPMHMGWEPENLLWCCCCGRQHPASDCVVYSYYDGPMIYCADGLGCKDPQVIAAKKAREFANRSAAQRARWAKASNEQAQGAGGGLIAGGSPGATGSTAGTEVGHGT